jgi:uncharacterized protein YdaU (DUF1376 family)
VGTGRDIMGSGINEAQLDTGPALGFAGPAPLNFYKHHIGDYAKDTEHLTWDEDQAYTRLMRVYYRDERPLPLDVGKVVRLVRAQSPTQKAAVETVLNEFFTKESDGWHNKRCDLEINQATTQAETNRRIAEKREAAKKTRTVHESLNGSSTTNSGSRKRIVNLSRLQTPDSTSQTPLANLSETERASAPQPKRGTRIPDDFELTDARRLYAKDHDVNPDQAFALFTTYWRAKSGAGATKIDWDATWQHWVLKDAKTTADRDRPRKTRFALAQEALDRA